MPLSKYVFASFPVPLSVYSLTCCTVIRQCVAEHWTEKIHEQSNEGCNIAGKVTVNKVIGNFHFSPGKSFILPHMNVQELVPYLKDGNPHGFGHIIHQFSFENEKHIYGDDLTKEMKKRLGVVFSPLDTTGQFVSTFSCHSPLKILPGSSPHSTETGKQLHVPIFPEGCCHAIFIP